MAELHKGTPSDTRSVTGAEAVVSAFHIWFRTQKSRRGARDVPRGTIGSALVVLERLKSDPQLTLAAHTAPGGVQISGSSGPAVRRILAQHGQLQPLSREGGRTNPGVPAAIQAMLETLQHAGFGTLGDIDRAVTASRLQQFLAERVPPPPPPRLLKLRYDPTHSTWQTIGNLLALAQKTGKEGPVAQYLVGARLQLRYPELSIGNESFSTADDQLGRPGDFHIGDTAFHVTVAPMAALYDKCRVNLQQGLRAFILVPDRSVVGARQNAEGAAPGRIAVESIESFVSQNIEELSAFQSGELKSGFSRLLHLYNERVDLAENDKSLMIEIPRNLSNQ
jgi:hypothetical protein